MGKMPVLRWVSAVGFGLTLAGSGCESCSNTAKRTYNPAPTIVRNNGTPAATVTAGATGIQAGSGLTAAATTVNPPASPTNPVVKTETPAAPIIQTVGAIGDTTPHAAETPMNPYAQTAQTPVQGTSRLGPQAPTQPIIPPDTSKTLPLETFSTPPPSSNARDDGLGHASTGADSIRGSTSSGGALLPVPPSSIGSTGTTSILSPAPPAPPPPSMPPMGQNSVPLPPMGKLSGY